MNKNELLERYNCLYEEMKSSNDVEKMVVFGNAEKKIFGMIAEMHPEISQEWLDRLESGSWNNFVSQKEYADTVARLEDNKGNRGGKWQYEQIKTLVSDAGGEMECKPFYNGYALALVINMLYSDHSDSAEFFLNVDDIPSFFYAMAVDKLKDRDRRKFVREYFCL